jgi:hypothetical protein
MKTALNVRYASLRKAKATAIHSEHHSKGGKADYPGGTFAEGFHGTSPHESSVLLGDMMRLAWS